MKDYLETQGAEVLSHVTKNTNCLIVGNERGENKYNDAIRKGVTILPWTMAVYLGIFEERPGKYLDTSTSRLVSETVFEMTRIVDNVYAHSLREPRLRRAFLAGAEAIDSLLRAAWGGGVERLGDPCEDDYEVDLELVNRHLRECITFWGGLINEMG